MWKENPGVGDHRTNDQREDSIREIGFQAGLEGEPTMTPRDDVAAQLG